VARVVRGVDALVAARRVVALGAGSGLAADPLDALAATSGEAEKERERDESNDPHPGRTTI
jgi:predicted nicotinamide N-methyase